MPILQNCRHMTEGLRLYLRGIQQEDVGEAYCQWMNDPDVTRCLESRFYPATSEALKDFIAKYKGDQNVLFLAIIEKESNRHIGNIKLGPINWIHRFADVGIIIGEKDCWGKGYATEAIQILSDYAFKQMNLHKLTAGCYAVNEASAKAFQKAGFSIEGIRKSHYFYEGNYVDAVMLGLLLGQPKRDLSE